MTTALLAALRGLKVTLFEASSQVGGTTATSAGTLWIPGNRHATKAGLSDNLDDARRYLDALIGSADPRGLRATYLASAADAVDYLEAHSSVLFRSAGIHPDYVELEGASFAGRAISPVEFDGRLLGRDFARVRAPLPHFMVLGGMMVGKADIGALLGRFRSWKNFIHSARLVTRYVVDRLRGFPRGTRLVMGNALAARLLHSLVRARVNVVYEARCEGLIFEQGQVIGVRLRHQGAVSEKRARCGVVLCAGGVGHNEALRGELGSHAFPSHSLSFEGNRGEGIQLARGAGAAFERSDPDFLWQPVSRVPGAAGTAGLYPHLFLDRAKPGLLAVDRSGRRFVNEGASYHHFVEGMRHRGMDSMGATPAYLICNASFVKAYGLGVVHPGTEDLRPWARIGYLTVAESLDSLARELGIDVEGLQCSVQQMNEAAVEGVDALFGKGSTEVSRFNGDPSHKPNPCLSALTEGPFVGLEIWPGESANSAGLMTSAEGEVLSYEGLPIPHLFACGNDMASIWRGAYPGPGATLGPAMVFAYRLVQRLAERVAATTDNANAD